MSSVWLKPGQLGGKPSILRKLTLQAGWGLPAGSPPGAWKPCCGSLGIVTAQTGTGWGLPGVTFLSISPGLRTDYPQYKVLDCVGSTPQGKGHCFIHTPGKRSVHAQERQQQGLHVRLCWHRQDATVGPESSMLPGGERPRGLGVGPQGAHSWFYWSPEAGDEVHIPCPWALGWRGSAAGAGVRRTDLQTATQSVYFSEPAEPPLLAEAET